MSLSQKKTLDYLAKGPRIVARDWINWRVSQSRIRTLTYLQDEAIHDAAQTVAADILSGKRRPPRDMCALYERIYKIALEIQNVNKRDIGLGYRIRRGRPGPLDRWSAIEQLFDDDLDGMKEEPHTPEDWVQRFDRARTVGQGVKLVQKMPVHVLKKLKTGNDVITQLIARRLREERKLSRVYQKRQKCIDISIIASASRDRAHELKEKTTKGDRRGGKKENKNPRRRKVLAADVQPKSRLRSKSVRTRTKNDRTVRKRVQKHKNQSAA